MSSVWRVPETDQVPVKWRCSGAAVVAGEADVAGAGGKAQRPNGGNRRDKPREAAGGGFHRGKISAHIFHPFHVILRTFDDFLYCVGPHLGARLKIGTHIGADFEAWTKVQPYLLCFLSPVHSSPSVAVAALGNFRANGENYI